MSTNTKIYIEKFIRFTVCDKNNKEINDFSIKFIPRTKDELQLDANNFYLKHGGIIPDQTIEMKIHEHEDFILHLLAMDTHIHKGNDNNMYICYPQKINSMDDAINIAKNWCLITTFHLTQKADVAWFEDFGNWMIRKTQAYQDPPNSFQEFPLWIQNGFLKWKVEVS